MKVVDLSCAIIIFFNLQCNNPLTKEAKLTAAMRILPEWKGYDDQIKRLQQKVQSDTLEAHSEFSQSQSSDKSHSGKTNFYLILSIDAIYA